MLDEDAPKQTKQDDEFAQFRRNPASVDALKRKKRFDKKRYDNPGPSLWTGKGADSYLFTNQTEKQVGDIIMVNVLDKLAKEITSELNLAEKYGRWDRKEAEESDKKKEATPKDKVKEKPGVSEGHISTIVEEEINKTHLLLKGRKTIIYKKQKKLIEFRGLVARKDISKDTINSNKILESTVKVLR